MYLCLNHMIRHKGCAREKFNIFGRFLTIKDNNMFIYFSLQYFPPRRAPLPARPGPGLWCGAL